MRTDFTLRFQWANNHSESVFCFVRITPTKMPTGTIWSFSNAKADVCSCRQAMARKGFFVGGEVVGTHSYPFSLIQEYFSEMKFGSLALTSSLL